ncbi:MAG: leucine-rich repeat domain-containing protein [Kiritimatiellae bacterium]|nr:leucine-rich repeat domain-containing protein [Kiritimatiellia bacterium]
MIKKMRGRGAAGEFHGKALVAAVLLGGAWMGGGCFEHREAPARPVSAKGVAEAEANAAEVEELDLSGSEDKALPGVLGAMGGLRILYLRGGAFDDFTALAGCDGLEVLDLGRVRLGAMPREVLSLKSLRDLYLCGCGLSAFPEGLETLPGLRYLNLDRNAIAALPETLPQGLRWLRLNHNRLASLPAGIGAMGALRRLYLRGNALDDIPAEIAGCAELTDIDLAGNNLEGFPEALAALPALRNLDLSGNGRISALPGDETLSAMKSLRTLRLTGCPLTNEERGRVRAALPRGCAIIF